MKNLIIHIFFPVIYLVALSVTSFGQSADDRIVVAQYGEGIISILQRNEMEPLLYLSEFIELNKEKISVDSLLYAGNTYLLPEKTIAKIDKKTIQEPENQNVHKIFGKKYELINQKDESLKDAVFYLVSGHGGPDPGAISDYGAYQLCEDEYSYDVTLRLARNLLMRGAKVFMIVLDENDGIRDDPVLQMDSDEVTYPDLVMPVNQRERLKQRTEVINDLYLTHDNSYQRLIVIHIDSRSNTENIDVFFYCHHKSRSGKALAEILHQKVDSKYNRHQPGRKYHGTVSSRSSLYLVKNTLPPMVYIELGNIKNQRDQRRFVLSDNRQALANWLSEGLIEDYKNNHP